MPYFIFCCYEHGVLNLAKKYIGVTWFLSPDNED